MKTELAELEQLFVASCAKSADERLQAAARLSCCKDVSSDLDTIDRWGGVTRDRSVPSCVAGIHLRPISSHTLTHESYAIED